MSRILLIDDSFLSRQIIKKILKTAVEDAYEIIEAPDGSKGLEIITSESVDCILLDLLMPEVDGLTILNFLRQQQIPVPVIVISADIQETTRQQCLDLGVFAFLNKIVDSNELLKTLKSALLSQSSISP